MSKFFDYKVFWVVLIKEITLSNRSSIALCYITWSPWTIYVVRCCDASLDIYSCSHFCTAAQKNSNFTIINFFKKIRFFFVANRILYQLAFYKYLHKEKIYYHQIHPFLEPLHFHQDHLLIPRCFLKYHLCSRIHQHILFFALL